MTCTSDTVSNQYEKYAKGHGKSVESVLFPAWHAIDASLHIVFNQQPFDGFLMLHARSIVWNFAWPAVVVERRDYPKTSQKKRLNMKSGNHS
jgi:tryptophan-rich sensory protein